MNIIYLDRPSYLPHRAVERLRTLGDFTVYDDLPTSEEAVKRLSNADIAIVEWTEITAEMLSNIARLKCIVLVTTGYDFIDVHSARKHEITVSNTPFYSTQSVAEHIFGMYLAMSKRIVAADSLVRAGKHEYTDHVIGVELNQKNLGIVGLGDIGSWVARIGNGFGMSVAAYTRTPKNLPNVQLLELDHLLASSDFVALCISVNQSTIGLLTESKLRLLKPTAFLANIANNGILDELYLAQMLNEGRLAGAAFDGAKNAALLSARNTLFSPGTAWYTQASLDRNVDMFVDSVFAFAKGTPQYVVN